MKLNLIMYLFLGVISLIVKIEVPAFAEGSSTIFRCGPNIPNSHCQIFEFNRLKNAVDGNLVNADTDRDVVDSIMNSKVLISGTVLKIRDKDIDKDACQKQDWKIVAQTKDSANILIYGASDLGAGSCGISAGLGVFLISLPVRVIWAEVRNFPGRIHDPMWRG